MTPHAKRIRQLEAARRTVRTSDAWHVGLRRVCRGELDAMRQRFALPAFTSETTVTPEEWEAVAHRQQRDLLALPAVAEGEGS